VLALPNALGRDRLGVVASKKIGGAVVRNRAKRRIREIFRSTKPQATESRRGYDLVVIARQDLPRAPFDAVRVDVAAVLGRVGRSRS
jgi:ribonuclease P protein component